MSPYLRQYPRLRPFLSQRTSRFYSRWEPLQILADGEVETFRCEAFNPCRPCLLPRSHFLELPAITKWFLSPQNGSDGRTLNQGYLGSFGQTLVPLELTQTSTAASNVDGPDIFQRTEIPLQIFLQWAQSATAQSPERLYLAQASFAALPRAMIEDLPTPELVKKAGVGDVYDTNIWMGIPPTYSPLHRDPNPNLFVQIAGEKVVRILPQDAGERLFNRVQSTLGKQGNAIFRGNEMMQGNEKMMLEKAVWDDCQSSLLEDVGYEARMEAGDGLFIPKSWWHSVKGIGNGVSGSVNWWFR